MGKGSKAPAPPDPQKTAAAEAQYNRLNTYSPSGSGQRFGYTDAKGNFQMGPPPAGRQSAVTTVESPYERAIRQALEPASLGLVNRMVVDNVNNMPAAARVKDRSDVARDLYSRSFSLMQPGIEQSNRRLLTTLQARGLPIGGDAFNEAYGAQTREVGDTLSRLSMDANLAAGQEQSRQFGLDSAQRQNSIAEIIGAMGGQYNPPNAVPGGNAAGVNYSGLVGQQYQAQMGQYQQNQQNKTSALGAIGGLGAALIGKSDRRVKRDIRKLGTRGRLNVYAFRYKWDAPEIVRVGYMAQEVLNVAPQAVCYIGDTLAVDYAQLPEVA